MFAGIAIMLVGAALLADRIGSYGLHLSGHYWPLLLVALGVVRCLNPPRPPARARSMRSGAWFVFLGGWALVNELRLFGFDYGTSWPLLIVGAGLFMVWRALEHPNEAAVCGRRE
jgi:hypothetical protein